MQGSKWGKLEGQKCIFIIGPFNRLITAQLKLLLNQAVCVCVFSSFCIFCPMVGGKSREAQDVSGPWLFWLLSRGSMKYGWSRGFGNAG